MTLPDVSWPSSSAIFPLVEALFGRRSRRFALGDEIPDGPLAYRSRHGPLPLTELERMLVLGAIGGTTGSPPNHPVSADVITHVMVVVRRSGRIAAPSAHTACRYPATASGFVWRQT
jgi:hypothetical protein